MTGLMLIALFSVTALIVGGAMRATWRDHGRQVLTIRAQLAACPDRREVRWTIRSVGAPSRINVLDFPVRQSAVLAPQPRPAAA